VPADTDTDRARHDMSDHVLGQLGLRLELLEDGHRLDLDLSPVHLLEDGSVDFGVLGVFLDLASSQPPEMRRVGPFLHADITVHQLRAPQGRTLHPTPRMARMGRRTGIVEIDVHDDTGVHVARSVQELVFPQGVATADAHDDAGDARAEWLRRFTGECTLAGPLREVFGIRDEAPASGQPAWSMPLSGVVQNGFGALYGGAAASLVDVAAAGVAADGGGPTRTLHAAMRFLAPGTAGPFLAVPQVVGRHGTTATVAVEIRDAEDRLIILADAIVSTEPHRDALDG
jgi:uncharacterized protein (TIGR00369 family)